MSIQSEISRIQSNVQDTINVIQSTGVAVPPGANSDNLPGLAAALANEKQDKLTGTPGQMVGFDSQGNAVAQDQGASNVSAENVSVPDTTASLYGLEDATVDQVLQKLTNAAILKKTGGDPIYTPVSLGDIPIGSTLYSEENGTQVSFVVAEHNYENELNDQALTLLVRETAFPSGMQWNTTAVNSYADSSIDDWLNTDYKGTLYSSMQNIIAQTVFPYTPGNGNYVVSELTREVFLLSATELGLESSVVNIEGSQIPLNLLTGNTQLTRSPQLNVNNRIIAIGHSGNQVPQSPTVLTQFKPAFCIPSDTQFYTDGESYYLEQAYIPVSYSLTNVLGQDTPVGAQIATGSYVGTGTYGQNNPCTLTFDFVPKVLFIGSTGGNTSGNSPWFYGFDWGAVGTRHLCALEWKMYSISWWSSETAGYQLNMQGSEYPYIILA